MSTTHLVGSVVFYQDRDWLVKGTKDGDLVLWHYGVLVQADPDLCSTRARDASGVPGLTVFQGRKESLNERLADALTPVLGSYARERANNIAVWAGEPERAESPVELLRDLRGAIEIVNRPDYGGSLSDREIDRAAALALAEVLA